MIVLIHIANVLYLLSYLVKDILWLRLLTVVAGIVLLAFYVFQPVPLWPAIGWNTLFLLINARQIHLLLLERRPVALPPDALRLHRLAFRSLTPREFSNLLAVGAWENISAGERFVRRGEPLERVMIIVEGQVHVETPAGMVALGPGRFVGEMSYITGQAPQADVVAAEATRIVAWPQSELRTFLGKNAELRAMMQMVLGEDLVAKLRPA
jgi:CRP-like cAMP-binding protein